MKISLTTILFIAVAVLLTLQLRSIFGGTPANEKIIRSDMRIEQLEKQVIADSIALKEVRRERDSAIALSDEKFKNLEGKKQPIKNAIKQIPVVVNNFDKEQLHRAISNF